MLQCVPYRRLLVVHALTTLIQLARAHQQAAADPGAKTISCGRDLFTAIQHEIMESTYNHLAVGTLQADLHRIWAAARGSAGVAGGGTGASRPKETGVLVSLFRK